VYEHYDYRAAAYKADRRAGTYDEVTFRWIDGRARGRSGIGGSRWGLLALDDRDFITAIRTFVGAYCRHL